MLRGLLDWLPCASGLRESSGLLDGLTDRGVEIEPGVAIETLIADYFEYDPGWLLVDNPDVASYRPVLGRAGASTAGGHRTLRRIRRTCSSGGLCAFCVMCGVLLAGWVDCEQR